MQAEVANSVIEQIGSQIDLLITLALGTCGALSVLILQVVLHNSEPPKNVIQFRSDWLLLACLILQGFSIICGYLSRATMTSLTPAIFRLPYHQIENFTDAPLEGGDRLRSFAGAQVGFFILGVLFVVSFVALNLNLLRRKRMRPQRLILKGLFLILATAGTAAAQPQAGASDPPGFKAVLVITPGTGKELLETAARMTETRHRANPHGYEKDLSFLKGFQAMQERLYERLTSETRTYWTSTEMLKSLSSALEAYTTNLPDYLWFHKNLQGYGELGNLPPDRIAANLLTLYLVVDAVDPQLASELKKGSYIWPFCLTINAREGQVRQGVTPMALLFQLEYLKREGHSVPFMVEYVNHVDLGKGFVPSEVLQWREKGIPEDVIRAVLEKLARER